MAMPQKQFFCGDISATFAPISKVISAVNTANISTLGSMDEVPEPISGALRPPPSTPLECILSIGSTGLQLHYKKLS